MINFSGTENLSNLIELEKVSLESTLDIQKNFNKQILVFVKKFMGNIDFSLDSNDKAFFYLNESTSALNKSNSNINDLKELLNCLSTINICDENSIKNYNTQFKENMNSIYSNTNIIEKFIQEITLTDFSELPNNNVSMSPISNTETSSNSIIEKTPTNSSENTLIISETNKKVVLPYKTKKIEEILANNTRYHSIEEVVNKFYTKPISYYKFSPIARFKEAYKLVKEKEKGSTFKALALAFELFGNYSLHPAIITACKSIDELDIYLACLDENSLDDFKFFNIKYEIPLAVTKFSNI